ncbi:MAG TPA: hypothetical protein V6C86_08785 [Oculatellaceae cyanobacterium]
MRRLFAAITTIAPTVAIVVMMPPAFSQLPPTNMGKYVHQPGDNQYAQQAQQERHGAPAPVISVPVNQGGPVGNGWQPTPHVPQPDVSIEPIAADEPVVAAGFPPLPDRLDLPVSTGWSKSSSYGGGGGGPAPGGPPQPVGVHQHYNHYDPGAFIQDKGRGYYKANTAPMPVNNHDSYSAAGNGGRQAGAPVEPRLNPANDRTTPTDAPAPVVLNQAKTQDLSLPDDDFSYGQKPTAGSKFLKKTGRMVTRPIQQAGSMATSMSGMGMGMGMSKMKF